MNIEQLFYKITELNTKLREAQDSHSALNKYADELKAALEKLNHRIQKLEVTLTSEVIEDLRKFSSKIVGGL